MQSLYVETSVINRSLVENINGYQLNQTLKELDFYPVVGSAAVYELAKTFLCTDGHQKAKQLFILLRELNPPCLSDIPWLYKKEIQKLRRGQKVNPLFNSRQQKQFNKKVKNLAKGNLSKCDYDFIVNREFSAEIGIPEINKRILKQRLLGNNGTGTLPNTFEDFMNLQYKNQSGIRNILIQSLAKVIEEYGIKETEIDNLASNLSSYPSMHNTIRSYYHLKYKYIKNENIPTMNKLYDYRHIILSSYCDCFLSNDTKQRKAAPLINTRLNVLPWKELLDRIK